MPGIQGHIRLIKDVLDAVGFYPCLPSQLLARNKPFAVTFRQGREAVVASSAILHRKKLLWQTCAVVVIVAAQWNSAAHQQLAFATSWRT